MPQSETRNFSSSAGIFQIDGGQLHVLLTGIVLAFILAFLAAPLSLLFIRSSLWPHCSRTDSSFYSWLIANRSVAYSAVPFTTPVIVPVCGDSPVNVLLAST